MRLIRSIVAAGAAAMLAGCAGESVLQGGMSADRAVTTGESDFVTASAPAKPAFNPFADGTMVAAGGREIIANPTVEQVMLTGPLPDMAVGRSDAPVTIIKYASLTCPYCRRFQLETFPELKRTYVGTGKVRFILREFPIGFQSGMATIALRCAPPEKYFDLYAKFLTQQAQWVSQEVRIEPILKVASQVGITRDQFDACRKNQGMIDGLKWVKDRGRALGIIGTPNFFINGRLIKSVLTMREIHELVQQALAAASPARAQR